MTVKTSGANYDRFNDVPRELRDRCRFCVDVHNAASRRRVLIGYAESYVIGASSLILRGAIVDSSDRYEGVQMKERWSFHDELVTGGSIVYVITKLELADHQVTGSPDQPISQEVKSS